MLQKIATTALTLVSIFSINDRIQDHKQENVENKKMFELNQLTKKSIASSWFEIPDACKAKNFNADPIVIDRKELSVEVAQIFNTLG